MRALSRGRGEATVALLSLLAAASLACGHFPFGDRAERIALAPGAVYPRTLSGVPYRFRFAAGAGRFLHLAVDQRGVDVVVFLRDPSGRLLFEVDSPTGKTGEETVLAVTPAAGEYLLVVEPFARGARGAFALEVREARPARPEDRARAAAAAPFARAERRRMQGDFARAATAYREALPRLAAAKERGKLVEAEWQLGRCLVETGELRQATAALERAAAERRSRGDGVGEARVLNDLGSAWRTLGEPRQALAAHGRALELYRVAGSVSGRATTENDIGLVLETTGDLQGAIGRYQEALASWRQLGARAPESATLQNLGSLYALIGYDREADDLLKRSLALVAGDPGDREPGRRTSLLIALGWAQYLAGRPERALDRYREALALAERSGDRLGEAGVLDRRGSAFRALRRYGEAADSYGLALERSRAAGSRLGEGRILANLGWLDLDTGAIPRARLRLRQALERLAASGDRNTEAYALVGLSRAERRLGDLGAAREQAETAVRLVRGMRAGLRGPASRGLFLATRFDAYEELVGVLMDLDQREPGAGHAREALEVAERARAQNLLEAMAGSAEAEPPLTAAGIQALADRRTLLVVYLLAEPASFAWTVDGERIEAHVLPGRERIETLARRAFAALADGEAIEARGTAAAATRELSQAILAPLGRRLDERPNLAILADGALHLVPFAALPIPSSAAGAAGEPLVARHEIAMIPSAAVLAEQRRRLAGRAAAPGRVAALGDPVYSRSDPRLPAAGAPSAGASPPEDHGPGPFERLPFTAEEARAIAGLVPRSASLLALGPAASLGLVESGALRRYGVLHFAAHGLLDPILPERSGIALSLFDARGRRQDGFLSAPRVARLDLPAELAVLSGCETGLGRELRGEGLVGLTQAFFRAGTRRVLVSSWKVRDRATAELMGRFYRHLLLRRLPAAAALRLAQLELQRDQRRRSPYYWAGFSLQGDWR